jgi:hypothetical protein
MILPMEFFTALKFRNPELFWFGLVCLLLAIFLGLLSKIIPTQFLGISAFYKPIKFCLSTTLFVWTMAWFCFYLPQFNVKPFSWSTIVLLGFEIAYILVQASAGKASHFNLSTPFYTFMYSLMALAASLVTIYTAYIGLLFFKEPLTQLPDYYVWGIRLGILLFVIFSFQGFAMGSRLTHTIGAADGGKGIPFLNWSVTAGDLRIAHFVGMHALQLIPLLSFYVLRNTKATIAIAMVYGLVAFGTWFMALKGKSPFSF